MDVLGFRTGPGARKGYKKKDWSVRFRLGLSSHLGVSLGCIIQAFAGRSTKVRRITLEARIPRRWDRLLVWAKRPD